MEFGDFSEFWEVSIDLFEVYSMFLINLWTFQNMISLFGFFWVV